MVNVLGKLKASTTTLLVCDVQGVFQGRILGFDALVKTTSFMMEVADKLDVPIWVSEQYPEKLKSTVEELPVEKATVYPKTKFSMCSDPEINGFLRERESVVICGLETHVCVLQTALDCMEMDLDVHICVDAVSSQRDFDRSVALSRLAKSGAFLSTSESLVFQMLGDARHEKFKGLQPAIKAHAEFSRATNPLHAL